MSPRDMADTFSNIALGGVAATVGVIFLGLLIGPVWERHAYLRGATPCCGAKKYGWPSPFGWVVKCSACHRDSGDW